MAAFTKSEVRKAISLRSKGESWDNVQEALERSDIAPRTFVGTIRPLMREVKPESIKLMGRAAPAYGAAARKAARKAKRSTRKAA